MRLLKFFLKSKKDMYILIQSYNNTILEYTLPESYLNSVIVVKYA